MYSTRDLAWKIAGLLRGSVASRDNDFVATIALCHAKRATLTRYDELIIRTDGFAKALIDAVFESDCDRHVAHLIAKALETDRYAENADQAIRAAYEMLPDDADELADIILDLDFEEGLSPYSMRGTTATPGSITSLAISVLDIKDGERVADFGAGTGAFLVKAANSADCELVYGCEKETAAASIAMMRAALLGPNVIVEQADMLRVEGTFDKCFSNYPFFMMSKHGFKEDALSQLEEQGFSGLPRFVSSDWIFNLELIARLREGGKAVGVMTRGSSFNGADMKMRRHFIGNGWIEAVIALPDGIFSPAVNVPTTMLVLSKGNESIRMVDASEICQKGRRKTTFADEDIAEIVRLLGVDEEGCSCTLSFDELAADDFNLNPTRHLAEAIEVDNGASIESLSARITRGSNWSKAQLEELNSNKPTKFRYLMLKNIVDGELEDDLPYLTEIDPTQDRYCVCDGDLLLSKIGPNFKVAVASIPDGEKVLATGNLYIIQLDTTKVDARYVKLYLETDQGVAQLRRACVGTTMLSIPAKAFADIDIPMIPMDEQLAIAERYEALREEMAMHRMAIERAQQKIAGLLDGK